MDIRNVSSALQIISYFLDGTQNLRVPHCGSYEKMVNFKRLLSTMTVI